MGFILKKLGEMSAIPSLHKVPANRHQALALVPEIVLGDMGD